MGSGPQFFQPPLHWQQFEDMTTGLLREVYDVPNAQQYGRPGQAQDGVDVYGRSKRFGRIGIQCKRLADLDRNGNPYPGGPISRAFLRKEADESLAFKHDLDLWILATTARRDTRVQNWVEELNKEWASLGRTALVWSWDECVSFLNTYPNLPTWYYQNVIAVTGPRDLDEILLKTIAMAFSRPAFEVPLHAETTDEFLQALKDTQQAMRTGELVDRVSRHVIRKAVSGFRDLDNRDWRDGLGRASMALRELRVGIETGLRDGSIRRASGMLEFQDPADATLLEAYRDEALREVNDVLIDAGLPSL